MCHTQPVFTKAVAGEGESQCGTAMKLAPFPNPFHFPAHSLPAVLYAFNLAYINPCIFLETDSIMSKDNDLLTMVGSCCMAPVCLLAQIPTLTQGLSTFQAERLGSLLAWSSCSAQLRLPAACLGAGHCHWRATGSRAADG